MECKSVAANADLSNPYINNSEETDANTLNSQYPKCLIKVNEEESESGKSGTWILKDEDLLISVVLKNKLFKSMCKQHLSKQESVEHLVKQKRFSRPRTVLSWVIHSGVLSPGEVIQCRSKKSGSVAKEGFVTRKGISCRCCKRVFSITKFNSHAGVRHNPPFLNLFTEFGKPFTLCLLEAWSIEYKARIGATQGVQDEGMSEDSEHDRNCGRCGDVKDLICCHNCASAFHPACLNIEVLPEQNWYCPQCTCQPCGQGVNTKEAMAPPGAQCVQCENRYHKACMQQGVRSNVASDTWFCTNSCQEVYSGLQAQIGLVNQLPDGCSWALLKCMDGDQKAHSASHFLTLKATCNPKLAVALMIPEESFEPMLDPTTGVDIIPQMVYNLGSRYARVNYSGFYTVVMEKDDELVALASIRVHGVKAAEIPFVATSRKHQRRGMCKRLFDAIENMLKSLRVEKLILSAVPESVDMWRKKFGFKFLEDSERLSLKNMNMMTLPESIYLKKPLLEG